MKIRLLGCFLLILCLSSCRVKERIVEIDKVNTLENQNLDEKEFLSEMTEYEMIDDIYIIKRRYIEESPGKDIEIYYPELRGIENEEAINLIIQSDMKRAIPTEEFSDEWIEDGYKVCVYMDYDIKYINEFIISILYKGMSGGMVKGLDGTAMATTIDFNHQQLLTLNDIIADADQLYDMLLADKFENVTLWEGTQGTDKISTEYGTSVNRTEILKEALYGNLSERRYLEWYTDGTDLIIVSVSHFGISDYNEYSLTLQDLNNIIQEKFLKWVK